MGILDTLKRGSNAPAPNVTPKGGSGRFHTGGFIAYDEINQDLRGPQGLRLLDKMWRTDGAVRGSTYMCVAPIAGGTWTIEPYHDEDAEPTEQDKQIASYVYWALFEEMRPKLTSHIWTAMMIVCRAGFAPFEQLYKLARWQDRDVWTLKTLDLRLPSSIYRWNQDGPDLVSIEQFAPGMGMNMNVTLPAQDLAYYRFGAEGDNWEGQAIIRPAYKHWKYKDGIELVDAISIEKFAVGVPVAYPPASPSPEDMQAAEDAVAGIRANEAGYIVAPGPHAAHAEPGQGWLFEILTPGTTTGESKTVQASLQYHRTEITATILAEFMRLGQQGVGARATADVQQDPHLKLVEAIAGMVIEDTINEQVIPRLVALNFDTDRMPKLSCSLIDSTTLGELGDYVQKLTTAGAIRPEPTLEGYLRDRADLPPADEAAIAAKQAEDDRRAQEEAKAAAALRQPPAGADGGKAGKAQLELPVDEPILLARQDRELKPWEQVMSLDTIEGAINEARARFEQAAGPAARALAMTLAEQAANGRRLRPADPPTDLIQALTDEMASLYVTGRHTVTEELDRQRAGLPAGVAGGVQLASFRDAGSAAKRIASRARAAAEAIRAAITIAIARQQLRTPGQAGAIQSAGEIAGMSALRVEAVMHAAPALNMGRADQASEDSHLIAGSRYTSILDGNRCRHCAQADDDVLRPLDDPVRLARKPPNPECEGGDRCRCMEAFQLKLEDPAALERADPFGDAGGPVTLDFNPNEPRDDHGRWTTSGSFAKDAKHWLSRLSPKERDAVRSYKTTGFGAINERLRKGEPLGHFQATADALDSAIAKGPKLHEDTTVYRGFDVDVLARNFDKLEGRTFPNAAFLSTSTDETRARAALQGSRAILATIKLPKGTRVGLPDAVSDHKELELLLGRGKRFRVIRTYVDATGTRRMDLEILR